MSTTKGGELKSLHLTDGRLMSYREYGDPQGRPVINCHGGLVCGSDIAPAHDTALSLGLRLISADRPGIGYSSQAPGRTTAAWADDVAELITTLNLSSVSAFGWSLGGQYALALAARLPKLERVVVVAGTPELDPDLIVQLNRMDRTLVSMAQAQPSLMRAMMGAVGGLAHYLPTVVTSAAQANLSPSDRAGLAAWTAGEFAACMHHALRQPQGVVEEYLVESRPWGFSTSEVAVPVTLWQGTEDRLVPPGWVDILAGSLPHAVVNAVAGAGHFLAYQRWEQVLAGALPNDSR